LGNRYFLDLDKNRLLVVFGITFLMMVVEFIGGILSGSIALVSDAAHMLVDAFALGCSALASFWAAKEGVKKIEGCSVNELRIALMNGIVLVFVAIFIACSVWQRFFNPNEIQSGLMLTVAVIGLFVNIIGIFLLHHGSKKNINIRGAFLHIVSDTLSSLGVIIGGIVIYFTGWYLIDSLLGFLIALMILRGGIGLIKDSIKILIKEN